MEKIVPTRNIVLTTEQEAFIGKLVKKGRYQNASEVLRHGLRLVEDEIQRKDIMLENLRQQLNAGPEQFEAGDLASGTVDEIFSRVLLKAKKNSKK
jgi:antitoxin ParD1/3/4